MFAERLNEVQPLAATDPAIAEILAFIDAGKHRALCLPAEAGNRPDDAIRAAAMTNSGFADFLARRPDRGRRRHAVRGRGLPDRARHQSRAVRAEGRLRSGSRGALSPSLDFGRPARPGREAVPHARTAAIWFSSARWCGRRCRRSGSTGARFACIGRVWAAFRGGDDHLLSGIGRILEQDGFRMVGIKDVAPDLLMPEGCLTRTRAR